jgi:membrane associated rhomboid family serine protease
MAPPNRELVLGRIRLPLVIAVLIATVSVLSIAAAVAARNGAPLIASSVVLVGQLVLRGEIWRLITFPLVEFDAPPLIFACLSLYWFSADLVRAWGTRRFLAFHFGLAAAAGLCTALAGLVWPVLGEVAHAGAWVVLDATIVAWGLMHARREIRLYGLIRITGRHLVWMTLVGTVLYALFRGLPAYFPHFAAEFLVLVGFLRLRQVPAWWRQRRQRALEARARAFDLNAWIEKDRRRR